MVVVLLVCLLSLVFRVVWCLGLDWLALLFSVVVCLVWFFCWLGVWVACGCCVDWMGVWYLWLLFT